MTHVDYEHWLDEMCCQRLTSKIARIKNRTQNIEYKTAKII
jgi:hypothetical protein